MPRDVFVLRRHFSFSGDVNNYKCIFHTIIRSHSSIKSQKIIRLIISSRSPDIMTSLNINQQSHTRIKEHQAQQQHPQQPPSQQHQQHHGTKSSSAKDIRRSTSFHFSSLAQVNRNKFSVSGLDNHVTTISQSAPEVYHSRNDNMSAQNLGESLYPIGQPYATECSNFGPIFHRHNHLSHGYGSPYEKIKMTTHMGQHYNSYQSYYAPAHQIVRPNNYIDLVPR